VVTGTTPCSLNLERGSGFFSKASYSVDFEKDGYESETRYVNGEVNMEYGLGNLLLGGVLGWLIIDPATGAMWDLEPSRVSASLRTSRTSASDSQARDREGSPTTSDQAQCAKCGRLNKANAKFCTKCGAALSGGSGLCSDCGHENPTTAKFCAKCGSALE